MKFSESKVWDALDFAASAKVAEIDSDRKAVVAQWAAWAEELTEEDEVQGAYQW